MLSFTEFLKEETIDLQELGEKLLKFKSDPKQGMVDLELFLNSLTIGNRAPNGLKKEYEMLKSLKGWLLTYKEKGFIPQPVGATISYWNSESISNLILNFSNTNKKKQILEIQKGNITFINESSLGEKKFIDLSNVIEKLLLRLKDEYKKSLNGDVVIKFKSATEMKSKAKYKQDLDEIWIRNSPDTLKLFDKELYGWVPYIIIHELGHRYDKLYGIPQWFNSSYKTSKYSISAGWADEEKWAECFAISFFGKDVSPEYSKWETTIEKFKTNFLK